MEEAIRDLLIQWDLSPLAWNLIIIGAAIVLGLLIKSLLSLFVRKRTVETDHYSFFRSILYHLATPFSYFLPVFLFNLLLPALRLSADIRERLGRGLEIILIILFAWILTRCIRIAEEYVYHRFDINKKDNLRERKIRTQLQFIKQLINGLIVVLTVAAVLLSFNSLRRIGAGLLTGVGIGGIIVGFAAQRSLGNLLAGFQIAFTQPIRIDDEVLVENEFGRIEEITLTYVVVRIWDERRLILPINYFIEKPFQNWTRTTTQQLGTVFLYTDYSVPVNAIRQELTRLLESSSLWDRRVNSVVVTNLTDKAVEVRALMSAYNSGNSFDLRCYVRENLLSFMRENYPDSLPRSRVELEAATAHAQTDIPTLRG